MLTIKAIEGSEVKNMCLGLFDVQLRARIPWGAETHIFKHLFDRTFRIDSAHNSFLALRITYIVVVVRSDLSLQVSLDLTLSKGSLPHFNVSWLSLLPNVIEHETTLCQLIIRKVQGFDGGVRLEPLWLALLRKWLSHQSGRLQMRRVDMLGWVFLRVGLLEKVGVLTPRHAFEEEEESVVFTQVACLELHRAQCFRFRYCEAQLLPNRWMQSEVQQLELE